MPLAVGTKAPDFTLSTKTADGPKQIKLSDNFGKRNTLLLFFPMAFTGTCTTEMCDVSSGLSAYSNMNAAVYGISGDNPFARNGRRGETRRVHHRQERRDPIRGKQRRRETTSKLRQDQRKAGGIKVTLVMSSEVETSLIVLRKIVRDSSIPLGMTEVV